MASLLKSTHNTRAILPGRMRFIRSDAPTKLSGGEIQWLWEQHITTIVDLRTPEEQKERPCPLASDDRFSYFCMPVTGGNTLPNTVEDVAQSYIQMSDTQMQEIIDRIWNAKTNVLYFCSAGKDRTGVVSALLLIKAGFSDQAILEDYMLSKDNLADILTSYCAKHPQIDPRIVTPNAQYMKAFLNWYRHQ